MKKFLTYISVVLILGVTACKEDNKLPAEDVEQVVSTFYLIRHAEKDRSDANNIDPELTQKGLGRAMHWAEILNDVNLDAVYSTDYERTSQTAAPTAVKQDITVTYYNPADLNIEQLMSDNLGKNVLVVGHSNTTPDVTNQLIGSSKYAAMDDTDNGSLFIVQLIGNTVTDMRLEFNCNCPE
ncbi:MAG: histidine phosphatase family protein [Eudoraea sp.]|nr:histidine phosphatase family protein [Eudoraea sp.]